MISSRHNSSSQKFLTINKYGHLPEKNAVKPQEDLTESIEKATKKSNFIAAFPVGIPSTYSVHGDLEMVSCPLEES